MTVINTETAMEHLRLDDEIDKTMVEGYLAAAEDAAMQFLNRCFFADQAALDSAVENESAGDRPLIITPSIQSAVLLIVGWLYENRGDDLSTDIPGPARWLLNPWRIQMGV
ncbi:MULTISPECIES: head-tail connector protein [Klebsiella]|uniref:head-tail connector protein n=1 Tax=Klebsiella TaxID=570 RepID=UPI0009D39AED|nr:MULTISPECIES: head-tail connector protein [Klebsiella]EIX9144235.1 phage gp6-like head-tail connector protein [Klebsiella pneumoniae]EJI4919396.1 phage gp6-like head-tail connector protein [Klebsiella pneumoniae]EKU9049621.1 phage gp6-like head-tail connector protein [Klebsiella pneumoniae]ELB4112962.1 phage gp6-like head-tail connector protein [Klebsiella pneumoniae]MBG2096968.1 phage gp6-like head-tail connector protein [Klebsiella pneumoniae]